MTVHNKMVAAVFGADATVHPLLGCTIGHGNGTPEQQARNWLWSRRKATMHNIAGRDRTLDLTEAEYRKLLGDLAVWEKTNCVAMPPPILGYGHRPAPPAPAKPESKPDPFLALHLRPHEQQEVSDRMDAKHPPVSQAKH
jgi:hypothetical protein